MKHFLPVLLFFLSFSTFLQAAEPVLTPEESQAFYRTLLEVLQNPGPCYSPKTHLIYGCDVAQLPTPEMVRDLNPNPVGYGSGLDDCALYSGTLLYGLVRLYNRTHDDALAPLVRDAWLGMRNIGSAHRIRGYVTRGVHPDDPTATYVTSSRDQYTHYVESIWAYYFCPVSTAEDREEIKELLTVLADSLIDEITPENDWSIRRSDGLHDPRGLHKMWKVYAHEWARLPMIYAAAWQLTGNEKYRAECLKYLDEAITQSLDLPNKPENETNAWIPSYSLYQMACSLEVLYVTEPDAERKARILEAIRVCSAFSQKRLPKLTVGRSSLRDFSELLIAESVLPDLPLPAEAREPLKETLKVGGLRSKYLGQTAHLIRLYANAVASGLAPLPDAVSPAKPQEETTASASPEPTEKKLSRFVWTQKPNPPCVNPNLVHFVVPGVCESEDFPKLASLPARTITWATGWNEEISLPRADFILTDAVTDAKIETWKARKKPFFVLVSNVPTVESAEAWNALKAAAPAFQAVIWGKGPEPWQLKLDAEAQKYALPVPLGRAYLQMDRWEFVLRPVSSVPEDIKARRPRVWSMTPDLVAASDELRPESVPDAESYVRVSVKNPSYLELTNGSPYIPIGTNLCILRDAQTNAAGETIVRLLSDEEALERLEFYFQKISENGGNYARIWLGMPQFDIETERPGHFDPKKIENVRRMLDLASKYGIRLKLCIEHFRKLGEEGPWENGHVTFSKPIYRETLKNMQGFTDTETGRAYYLARTAKYIEEFGSHPAVYGWELWNEVYFPVEWTYFMLDRVNAMQPKQMVFQSLGSFDSEVQYQRNVEYTNIPKNILLQIHRYYDPGAPLPICQAPMDQLCASAVQTPRSWGVKKPILATELGAVKSRHSGPSELYEIDTEGVLFHDILFAPFFTGSAGSGHCWHWNIYLEKHDLWWQIGRFTEAIKGVNPIEEAFEPFTSEQNGLRLYGLKGTKTTLVWIRDGENDSKKELIEKKPVETRQNVTVKLDGIAAGTLDCYDPWTNTHTELTVKDGVVTIPALKRSCVLRF